MQSLVRSLARVASDAAAFSRASSASSCASPSSVTMQSLVRSLFQVASDAAAFSRASSARSAAAAGDSVWRNMHSSGVAHLHDTDIPSSVDWTKTGILGPMKMQGDSVMRTLHSSAAGSVSDNDIIPSSVDWTKSGILGPMCMQGGSDCWAHAVVAAIEAINALVTGKYVKLSRKQLIDCNWTNSIIIGGYSNLALEYVIRNGGLVPEVIYPYYHKWERYRELKNVPLVTINDYGCVPHHSPDELRRAIARQPVIVSVATDESFISHQELLLPASIGGKTVNHDVLAVAYNDEKWKIMNSWDCSWGEGGFAEIPRSLDHLGGAYGILRKNSYYPIKTCENRYGNISHESQFSN